MTTTKKFASYLRNNRAVSALEYAILVGVIAVAIAAALTTFSDNLTTAIEKIGTSMTTIKTATPDADGG